MIPHTTPVRPLINSDAAIDVAGVDAGIDGHAVRTPTVVKTPSTSPTAAPTAVNDASRTVATTVPAGASTVVIALPA